MQYAVRETDDMGTKKQKTRLL